jgi:hypothetical protein
MFEAKKAPVETGEPLPASAAAITAGVAAWHRDVHCEFPRRADLARRILITLFEQSGKPN